jgi:hypothetical protein
VEVLRAFYVSGRNQKMRESTGFVLVVVGLVLVGFPSLCAIAISELFAWAFALPFIALGAWAFISGLAAITRKSQSSRTSDIDDSKSDVD